MHVSGFDDQRVNVSYHLRQLIRATYITHMGDACAWPLLTEHLVWLDRATIGQGDGFAVYQVAPPRTRRDRQLLCFFRQERSAVFFLEQVTEAVGSTVP